MYDYFILLFHTNQDVKVDVVAVLNDTTATQLAVFHKDPHCHMGFILSAGMNACYTEEVAAVPDYPQEHISCLRTIINTEICGYGEDGALEYLDIYTPTDEEVDNRSTNPREQR